MRCLDSESEIQGTQSRRDQSAYWIHGETEVQNGARPNPRTQSIPELGAGENLFRAHSPSPIPTVSAQTLKPVKTKQNKNLLCGLGHTFVPLGVSVSCDDMWSRWSLRTLSLLSPSTQPWAAEGFTPTRHVCGPHERPHRALSNPVHSSVLNWLHTPRGGEPWLDSSPWCTVVVALPTAHRAPPSPGRSGTR